MPYMPKPHRQTKGMRVRVGWQILYNRLSQFQTKLSVAMIELFYKDLTRVRHANATDHFGPLAKHPARSISFAARRHIIGTRSLSKSETVTALSSIYLDTANSFARGFGKGHRARLTIRPPS
jgi:hypothetical protein